MQTFRLTGLPGGLVPLTSPARIGAYRCNLSVWNPTSLPDPPIPHLVKLIALNTLCRR